MDEKMAWAIKQHLIVQGCDSEEIEERLVNEGCERTLAHRVATTLSTE